MPVIIHRDINGEHILSKDCWCEPLVIEDDDLRTNSQIHKESAKRDLKQ